MECVVVRTLTKLFQSIPLLTKAVQTISYLQQRRKTVNLFPQPRIKISETFADIKVESFLFKCEGFTNTFLKDIAKSKSVAHLSTISQSVLSIGFVIEDSTSRENIEYVDDLMLKLNRMKEHCLDKSIYIGVDITLVKPIKYKDTYQYRNCLLRKNDVALSGYSCPEGTRYIRTFTKHIFSLDFQYEYFTRCEEL